ncbi:hypothetical protein MRX96_039220 [Rhipicephalus microplus]
MPAFPTVKVAKLVSKSPAAPSTVLDTSIVRGNHVLPSVHVDGWARSSGPPSQRRVYSHEPRATLRRPPPATCGPLELRGAPFTHARTRSGDGAHPILTRLRRQSWPPTSLTGS